MTTEQIKQIALTVATLLTTVMMLITNAFATETANATQQTAWQAALMPILGAIGTALAALLVGGLRKLVLIIEKKYKIDVSDTIETAMYEKARWAVAFVEEKAEKRLLHEDGVKTSGAQKMAEAIGLVQSFANTLGYGQEWQYGKIKSLIEGVLHLERDVVIGSVGTRAEKLAEKKKEK
ncbi:MAG: hypothetical protein PVI90_00955 [Desulfobacteraceae bacterium]|jgi:hypothetical protein